MFSRLQRRRGNLQDLGRLSKSCPAVDHEGGEEDDTDSQESSSSDSWGSTASLSDPFAAESGEEAAPSVSRAEKQLAQRSLRQAKKREVTQKRNMEQNKISMDDYLGKQAHFRLWLQEEQKKQAKDLSSPKRKTYFKMFVRLWNKRHLPAKYYETRLSWHTEGEEASAAAGSPAEKQSPLAPERGRFSLLQNSPAMDPSLFPHTIDLSSDSIALPTPSPSSFSTFGKSTPLSSLLPFKFPGSNGKKALSEHMVVPRSADKGVFGFGEDKENIAHLSLPATMVKTEHLRTATISPRKKMMSTCQGRSLDRVSISWSPQGQLKSNPVDTPRCPSPFATLPPSSTNTTVTTPTSREEVSRQGPASEPVSDIYHQVKDVLTTGSSPEYADVTGISSEDGGVQYPGVSLPPVQISTKSRGHRRRSRSVEEAPVYAVPSRQLRDRVWSEKTRPLSEEGGSLSPPPIPPKRFDPHVEGLGIPFSPPVLAPRGNADLHEKGGDGGASGKDHTKKSGKMFKFSWFGKKLTSRRRSRSCEALSPSVQRAGDTAQAGGGLFPLVQLERSPTLGRRALTRPHKPPGKHTDATQKKTTLDSSSLPQAAKKKPEVSPMNRRGVTQHPSSLAREAGPPASNKPPNKLKFELTEYSSSPMRLGCGNKLVTFSGPEKTSKRGNGLRRRSRSLESIPSEAQDRSLALVSMREQVPEEPVGCELYEEVKSEVRSELSDLVNKLRQRSSADISQTPHQQYTTTTVKELKSSPKRLGRREKPEEASSSEAMNLHAPCPEVIQSAGGERTNDLQAPCTDVTDSAEEGRGSPKWPDSISSESRQGTEESVQVCSVTDKDVLMKDATEEEQTAVVTDFDHHLEMQWTQIAEEVSKQMSEGTPELQSTCRVGGFSQEDSTGQYSLQDSSREVKLQRTHNPEGAPQQRSKADTVDWQNSQSHSENEEMAVMPCTENMEESPCQESSSKEKGIAILAEADDKLAPPCRAEQACVVESPFESYDKLTDSVNNTLQTDSGLSVYTDPGTGEGLSASHPFLPNESSGQKDVKPPKSVSCEANQKILPPSALVCETPSQKEMVRPPSHQEEVAFSVTLPTAQHITLVSKPLTPKKGGPQRRRSRSVDMTVSGMGCLQTAKIQVHASSFEQPVDEAIPAPKTAAKPSDAEEKRINETHTPGIVGLVTQACKQPPPVPPKTLKRPVLTDSKALSALTATADPPHTLPKPQASLETRAVTDHGAAPAVTENATVSTVTAIQHGGPSRPTTHSRNRRRSRSVGDMTAMEEKGSEVHPGEGGGFASVRAFWDSMRGRGGREKGSGVSLQRKPSTMRRLQQQLFGSQQAEGGKGSASDLPPPPVTPQNMNVDQSTPSTQQAEGGKESASDLPPPPVTPQNMNVDQSTPSTQHAEGGMESASDLPPPPVTPQNMNVDQSTPSSDLSKVCGAVVTEAVSSGKEQDTKTKQHSRPAGARDSPAQDRAGGKEEKAGPPFHHSPFVTVRRQSSRKRSMLSESGTPGKEGSPQRPLDSPQPGVLQEGARCDTSASVNEGNFSPVCSLQTQSGGESGSSMRAKQSMGVELKAAACTINVEQHRDQQKFVTQSACSPSNGKRKPPPPRPPPKPAVLPFITATSRHQSPVAVMGQVSGAVRTRKRRSQEWDQTGVADKQVAVGDKADRPVLKAAAYHHHSAVISSNSSSPCKSPCFDKAGVDTAVSARVRRVKRRSGDEQEECDLRPVKRRSGSKNLFPAAAATTGTERKESLKRETTQSPIRQRLNRGEGQQSPAGRGQVNRKDSSSTPARKWSSVQAPSSSAAGSSSITSISSAGHTSSRMTVGRQDSVRKSTDNRQGSSSRVMVTRQASGRSAAGRRPSGGGNTPARTGSDRRESGGRGMLVKRDSDRRESGGIRTPVKCDSNRRQSGGRGTPTRQDSGRKESGGRGTPTRQDSGRKESGGRGTPTRQDSGRRQSGGRGTPTRQDSGRKESGGYGMVTRSSSNRIQAGGVNRAQGPTSTPVRTGSLARRRSGIGGASPASKRCSTGTGKPRRDSGGVKKSDSNRRHGGGEPHRDSPSRNGSFRKQGGLKTPQSPTFMRITRHLGVREEESSEVHENHFTVDEEQAQQIIAGLQKAQEKASDQDHHDTALMQKSHGHQLIVQDTPPLQAEVRKAAHLVTGEDRAEVRKAAHLVTGVDRAEVRKAAHLVTGEDRAEVRKAAHLVTGEDRAEVRKAAHLVTGVDRAEVRKAAHLVTGVDRAEVRKAAHLVTGVDRAEVRKAAHLVTGVDRAEVRKAAHLVTGVDRAEVRKAAHLVTGEDRVEVRKAAHLVTGVDRAEVRKAAHLVTGVDQREVENMETDIDMWEEEEEGLLSVGREACTAHLSTLV